MFNLQERIKGIDKDREYHATRVLIRDKLLSQGILTFHIDSHLFYSEMKQLEQNLRDLPTCKLTFPSTSNNGVVNLHEMELTV